MRGLAIRHCEVSRERHEQASFQPSACVRHRYACPQLHNNDHFSVVAKLSGLGWADELALMAPRYDRLAKHAPAREPKVLTDGSEFARGRWPRLFAEAVAFQSGKKYGTAS